MQQVKEFDYIGAFLFVTGFIVFLLGLSWGGSVYAWKSAHVIATMVVGGITLIIFALWETFGKLKEPLLLCICSKVLRGRVQSFYSGLEQDGFG